MMKRQLHRWRVGHGPPKISNFEEPEIREILEGHLDSTYRDRRKVLAKM